MVEGKLKVIVEGDTGLKLHGSAFHFIITFINSTLRA